MIITKPIFNKDKKTRKLEKEAIKWNERETLYLMSYYYGEFNKRTGDMNIYCYEYELKEIIKKEKLKNE